MQTERRPAGSRLLSLVFTTDAYRPRDRLDAWNGAFGSLNEISLAQADDTRAHVHTENWILNGGIVVSETSVGAARFVRDARRARCDQLDHWIVRAVRRGRGILQHPRFEVVTGPGDIVMFPASDIWTCDWLDVDWVTLCIPRDFDLRLTARLARQPPGLLRGAGARLLADLILSLPMRIAGAAHDEIPALTGVVLAALVASLPGPGFNAQDGACALVRQRAQRFILQHIASERLTPACLARAIGVSRAALYRVFEADGGVARFIRLTRLALAHQALQSADGAGKSIARIAAEHGFPDPPEFSRAFRAAFGLTPREVRLGALAGGEGPPALRPGPLWADMGVDLAARLYRRG